MMQRMQKFVYHLRIIDVVYESLAWINKYDICSIKNNKYINAYAVIRYQNKKEMLDIGKDTNILNRCNLI